MTAATFVLSAGRCGTQWLAKHLGETYADRAAVVHEPLFIHYLPRQLLGVGDPSKSDNAKLILDHVARIERQLAGGDYIECGWQCYAAIPYFAVRFAGRIRVLHLTRDPVLSASSLVTHRCYGSPPRPDGLTEKAQLTPFDAGTSLGEYRERWGELDPFDKCLYFWAEIHALALRLERDLGVPWLRLKFEDLFGGDGLDRLLDFLGLPRRPAIYEARGRRFDRFRFKTDLTWRAEAVRRHPRIVSIARDLGYAAPSEDTEAIRERYSLPSAQQSGEAGPRSPSRNARCPCGSGRRFKHCHGRAR